LPLLLNIVLKVLATAIRQQKEVRGIRTSKEEVKLALFADDMILYIENPKDSAKKLQEVIQEFKKLRDTKLTYKNQLHFYTIAAKYLKKEIKQFYS